MLAIFRRYLFSIKYLRFSYVFNSRSACDIACNLVLTYLRGAHRHNNTIFIFLSYLIRCLKPVVQTLSIAQQVLKCSFLMLVLESCNEIYMIELIVISLMLQQPGLLFHFDQLLTIHCWLIG